MMKMILKKEDRAILRGLFKVSNATMSSVVNYQRSSELHCEIRMYAMNNMNAHLVQL